MCSKIIAIMIPPPLATGGTPAIKFPQLGGWDVRKSYRIDSTYLAICGVPPGVRARQKNWPPKITWVAGVFENHTTWMTLLALATNSTPARTRGYNGAMAPLIPTIDDALSHRCCMSFRQPRTHIPVDSFHILSRDA